MPAIVRIDNRIRIPVRDVPDDVLGEIKRSCTHSNPAFAKKRAQGYSTYNVPQFIKTWQLEGEHLTVPRGCMKRVRRALVEGKVDWRARDHRVEGSLLTKPVKYIGHPLRDYQAVAVAAAMKTEQGVVRAATGSGKTTMALKLASEVGYHTLIILPNTKLLDQTAGVAEELLGLKGDRLGIIHQSKRRLRPVTLATQQTLWSQGIDEELQEFFGCVEIDEAHHCAARTFSINVDQFPACYRIAFTADEKRRDRMEFLVYDAFGDVLHETTREECEAAGAIVDVEVRVVLTDFEADWYRNDPDFDALLVAQTTNVERNALINHFALAEIEAGEQIIMLTHRREHVHTLEQALIKNGIRTGRMVGGIADKAEFESTRAGLRNGTVAAGVGTYEALGEGIDLPAVAAGFATTHIASNKQRFNQVRGRLCRPSEGKSHGRLYVFFDRKVFDERAFGNILSWNRTVKLWHRGRWVDAREHRRAITAA